MINFMYKVDCKLLFMVKLSAPYIFRNSVSLEISRSPKGVAKTFTWGWGVRSWVEMKNGGGGDLLSFCGITTTYYSRHLDKIDGPNNIVEFS